MPVFSSDQLVCKLVADPLDVDISNRFNTNLKTKYLLEYADGTPADLIDIGSDPWKYKMPLKDKWTWKFLSYSPDMPSQKLHRITFQEAFNSIEYIIPQKIDYEFDPTKKTDYTIEFLEDISVFDHQLTVLAHAWLYAPNSSKSGVVQFNDSPESKWYFTPLGWPVEAYLVDGVNFKKGDRNKDGSLVTRASQPALQIGMHEVRHATGERHDTVDPNSLMAPYVKRGWNYLKDEVIPESFQWTDKDIALLEEDFGKRNFLMRHLNRRRARRIYRGLYERYY